MKKLVIGSALAAIAFGIPAAAPAQKVGSPIIIVVDTERVYRECAACVSAQAQLQSQATALQTRAQALNQPLETEANAIRTAMAGKTTPDAATQARITSFQNRQNSAQQELANSEQNFNRNRAYVAQQIQTRLNPIIQQVMTARGANLALETGATLAHAPALDVTADVLTQLNSQLPSVSVTAPAAPAQPAKPQGR
jgi:Skp family chaperone for outer membrane proteins